MEEFTGYVPKVGDRVRISVLDYNGESNYFTGATGTVEKVAPNLSNCQVRLDDRTVGITALSRFFPGEIERIDG